MSCCGRRSRRRGSSPSYGQSSVNVDVPVRPMYTQHMEKTSRFRSLWNNIICRADSVVPFHGSCQVSASLHSQETNTGDLNAYSRNVYDRVLAYAAQHPDTDTDETSNDSDGPSYDSDATSYDSDATSYDSGGTTSYDSDGTTSHESEAVVESSSSSSNISYMEAIAAFDERWERHHNINLVPVCHRFYEPAAGEDYNIARRMRLSAHCFESTTGDGFGEPFSSSSSLASIPLFLRFSFSRYFDLRFKVKNVGKSKSWESFKNMFSIKKKEDSKLPRKSSSDTFH